MNIKEYIQMNTVYLDGAMGTLLQEQGLALGELPERWNLSHPNVIQEIHTAYFNAGSNIVATNTFGANILKFKENELEEIVSAAIKNAKNAANASESAQEKWVALDIGPCGKLLKPYGDLGFEEAVEVFAKTVRLGKKYGADLILIETMNDSLECKSAVLAAKENCDLPVFVSCAFGEDGKLMTGATPAAMVALLEGLGVDAIGVNCSVGPKQITNTVEELLACASIPVLVKPNAGLPLLINGETKFDISKQEFAECMATFVEKGARLVGGCCGTTPDYIKECVSKCKNIEAIPLIDKDITCISSYTHAVSFEKAVIVGERINPTGKKRFKQALIEKDTAYILAEGLEQEKAGAHVLDVNVGIPEINEQQELPKYVQELQAVTNLPLQLDTSDFAAMERAMRVYNGKPLVNSVNGKKECMERIFPLVKKYGGVVIALTLDENGIPNTAEKRVEIARKIILEAEKYGIKKKNILIDPLALTISADQNAALVTLQALRLIRDELKVGTSLGVSNISFGLPKRDAINATFFTLALENGLSAAIINPKSLEMMKAYRTFLALKGLDGNCAEYIRFSSMISLEIGQFADKTAIPQQGNTGNNAPLKQAIIDGLKENAKKECQNLLQIHQPQEIIENEIIPALDIIGRAYEEKRAFLPQLLITAEAAQSAFEVIKTALAQSGEVKNVKAKVVFATVQGDIHDIGKNIVTTILQNYGYMVVDLGKDVAPELILQSAIEENANIVGLSALMTTTLPAMKRTIQLLREKQPNIKIMVGGAVLTAEYANEIGADGYAKDAMAAVRLADSWCN